MPTIPTRRLGIALLAAAIVFTTGTAFAADLNPTAPGVVGAGEQDITAPCTGVVATLTTSYHVTGDAYYVDAVVLTGTGCSGAGLTVKVTLKDGASNPETVATGVAGADINAGLSVDVTSASVKVSDLAGLAILVTGP